MTTPSISEPDLRRFLSDSDWERLGSPSQWRWIAAMGRSEVAPIDHPRHQRWIQTHSHGPDRREVMLTLSGGNVFGRGGEVYELRPGTVMLFERGESRDDQAAPYQRKEPVCCLWLHLHDEQTLFYQIRGWDEAGRRRVLVSFRMKGGTASRGIWAAWDRCRAAPDDPLAWVYLKSLLSSLLLEILATTPVAPARHPHREVVQSLQRYIRTHLAGDLSLAHLARTAGYSPFFFHRVFREHTGQTVLEYVNALRIERAKELLRERFTVEAVVEQVGLQSASYFRRLFRKATGVSPGQWRRLG